jgi:hypothetical protein
MMLIVCVYAESDTLRVRWLRVNIDGQGHLTGHHGIDIDTDTQYRYNIVQGVCIIYDTI